MRIAGDGHEAQRGAAGRFRQGHGQAAFSGHQRGYSDLVCSAGADGDDTEAHRRIAGLGDPVSESLVYRLNGCRHLSLLAEPFRGSRDAASLGSREPDGDRRRRRDGGQLLRGRFCHPAGNALLGPLPGHGTVAFALAAPLQELWLIFLVLGLGMAAPWLFVALFPQTAALLPRPCRWMNTLKMALGVMMLASSLWLTTLLGLHLGETAGGMLTLALTVAAPIALLVARPRATPAFWLVIIALAAFAGFQVRGLLAEGAIVSSPEANAQQIRWQPLSEAAIQSALADGKRVFIDISADWCVTCKVNEYRVLNQPAIISALAEPDVVALRGDWSKPSEPIARFLQSRNRYAIPFNQVYGPGVPQGETLPPLLDQQSVLNALTHARG